MREGGYRGMRVLLTIGRIGSFPGEVRWQDENLAGIRFLEDAAVVEERLRDASHTMSAAGNEKGRAGARPTGVPPSRARFVGIGRSANGYRPPSLSGARHGRCQAESDRWSRARPPLVIDAVGLHGY
jgi:hypothetical protein